MGGGHSHVIVLRMLAMNPVPGLSVTLISPDLSTPYSGMLPGLIAGHYTTDEVYIDLVPLCRFANVNFVRAEVSSIDTEQQQVLTATTRPGIHYDILSIDIGSTPTLGGLASETVIPVKPIGQFLQRWQDFLVRYEAGEVRRIGFVGAGAGGVELCLAIEYHLASKRKNQACEFHLFTEAKTILKEFPADVRIKFEKLMVEKSIQVHREFRATGVEAGCVISEDDRDVRLDEIFWITQASAQSWPQDAGLAVDKAGFIQVDDMLRSVSHPNIFAVGDCAVMVNHPRPKAGVYAVRQGKPLFANITAMALGASLKPFRPQSRFLSLITTGAKEAVASRNGFSAQGKWAWRWKDWIDRRFMDRFSRLPEMSLEPVNALQAEFDVAMHCGGCGSKVSADLLREVLHELMQESAPVDDAAVINVPPGMMMLQSVDHFRAFLNDPYIQARIAVVHALSDIYACGGSPTSAMATLTLPFGKPAATRSMLTQILRGTLDQLAADNVELLGGHTSEGAELSLGYTANGIVDPGRLWKKQGMKSGDVLVLTKALGTGAIFAADMQHRAKGQWVADAVASMMVSNKIAADVLKEFSVNACTDVTGFGLAGHALEMLNGSQGVTLKVSDCPVLAGANACIHDLGIISSLHESNKASVNLVGAGSSREAEILFDPQTSGGLLVAIPVDEAEACVEHLIAAGCQSAAVVGFVDDEPGLKLV